MLSSNSYNAAIFKVVTGNDYRLELDDYDFGSDEWVSHYKDSALTWFSGNNLTSTYHEEKMSEYGDITLLIERIAIEFSHSDYASGMNKTLYLPSIEFPAILRTSDANEWANKINDQGYIEIAHLDSDWSSTIESPALNGILMLKIRGGFGRVGLRNSKIQMSLTFIIIVIFANATKVACLVVMLFQEDDETKAPMVTIGDAVASFLEKPDESTKNHCCWSQNEYFWKIGRIRRTRAREEDGRAATLDRRCQGVWERKRYQYGVALSESKRILLTIG
jgi:hypothetical protein